MQTSGDFTLKIRKNSSTDENKEDNDFIDRTNRALERMDKSDKKALSKEEFLKDLESW